MENIKCPKCGSTQLTTDKKGFSGKKAVAGAVLTGGIGLLAGTIGSNKIIITCLSCGNQFKPGEDMDAKNEKREKQHELNAKISNSPLYKKTLKVILGLFVVLILIIIFSTMSTSSDEKATSTTITDKSTEELSKYYEIAKEDIDRPTQRNISVYLSDTAKLKAINEYLISKYNANKSNYMTVTYFDDKEVAKIYDDKIKNEGTSEKAAEKLYKHIIANYNFNPSNGYESLNPFNKK